MIKICRIDHRLLHGQVAFVWCRSLNADAILIVSDAVAKDEMRMATMRLAKPAGVKLVIKSVEDSIKVINSGVTDKYKLMVVVENVQDAYDLVKACERIKSVNLGGSKIEENRRKLDTAFYVDDNDCRLLGELLDHGIELEIRQVPEIYMLQAILIGLIVFIGKADYFIGTAMFGRPLVLGALVGIVLGDIPTGVMIGFQLELIFMGMQAIGASIPPDMIVGSVLGTAFAITTGKGMETAITIAMPAAILSAFVVNLFYGVITPIMAKAADRFAEEGKYKKIEGVFLSNGFLFDLTFAVIAFGAFLFGGDSVTAVVNAIPGWLTTGISIAAGILPALGFAQLINMIMNKKVAVFFLLGFLLSAYMGISTVGIVCFSVVIVGILLIVKDFVPNQPALQGGMDDDNEF